MTFRALHDLMNVPGDCTVVDLDGDRWITDRYVVVRLPFGRADLEPGHYKLRRSAGPISDPRNFDPVTANGVGHVLDTYAAVPEWERVTLSQWCVYTRRDRHGHAGDTQRHRLMHTVTAGDITMRDEWVERHYWQITAGDMSLWYPSGAHPRVLAVVRGTDRPRINQADDNVTGFTVPTQTPQGVL